MTWNVLRVRSGQEYALAGKIVELGYRSFCPRHPAMRINRGRRVDYFVPLWSTYLLADWPRGDGGAWHRVMDLEGVSGVIGGIEPTPVAESEVAEWVSRADVDGVVTDLGELIDRLKRGYGRGDRVKIEGGVFSGGSGICNWFDGGGVNVKTALLGREVNIYVPLVSARVVLDDSVAPTRSAARRDRRRRRSRNPAEMVVSVESEAHFI